jgi:hypothetical protein
MKNVGRVAPNVQGLPQAVELDDASGRAALQIYFYLTAKPTRGRLAASLMLAAVVSPVIFSGACLNLSTG